MYVSGLKEEIVESPERVLELMEQGIARRHVGEARRFQLEPNMLSTCLAT